MSCIFTIISNNKETEINIIVTPTIFPLNPKNFLIDLVSSLNLHGPQSIFFLKWGPQSILVNYESSKPKFNYEIITDFNVSESKNVALKLGIIKFVNDAVLCFSSQKILTTKKKLIFHDIPIIWYLYSSLLIILILKNTNITYFYNYVKSNNFFKNTKNK